MASLLSRLQELLGQSFADNLLSAFWVWVFGFVMTGALTLWAYLRGVRGPILIFASGALTGVGSMVGLTVVYFWSRPAFYAIGGAVALAGTIAWWRSFRAGELARLSKYEKGLHDHLRDHSRGFRSAMKATAGVTRETVWIGKKVAQYTDLFSTRLGRFQSGHQFIVWLAARSLRSSAVRFAKHARRLDEAHKVVIPAGEGIVTFAKQNTERSAELKNGIQLMRNALETTIPSQVSYAHTLRNSPSMSQAYNASKNELASEIEACVVTLREFENYCIRLIQRLE